MDAPSASSTSIPQIAQLAQLAAAGFDLAHAFDAAAAAREPGLGLLAPSPTRDERLGLLVGNTRALWPPFAAALAGPELAADPHPLQRYTEEAIDAAFPGARIYYSHRRYGRAFLPFQRLAVATGLGALAPSQLVIHPIYGPWFALRAVIVAAGTPPPARPPVAQPCRCGPACTEALANARTAAGPEAWRAWLAVRDACPLREHRYGEDQIHYHYTRAWPALL
jgi:cyanocobalamin reductase (cyanide-eliminating) / alkylcobalamin dealkylase